MRPEEQTPIYKKAKEIQQLVESLATLVKESELPYADEFDLDLVYDKLSEMQSNTAEIKSLIVSSTPDSPYDYNMENAVFIKKAAHELIEGAVYIEDMGLKDIDYLDLLYDEIDALRVLFKDWIKTFELWKYGGEDWGLFSPEGIRLVYPLEEDDDEDYDEDEEEDDLDDDQDL